MNLLKNIHTSFRNYLIKKLGRTIFATHSIKNPEKLCQDIYEQTGLWVDYFYCGGRMGISYLGRAKTLKAKLNQFKIIHDQFFKKGMLAINSRYHVIGLDGNEVPFYADETIARTISAIWESNQQYLPL